MTDRRIAASDKAPPHRVESAGGLAHEEASPVSRRKATPGIEVRERAGGTTYRAVVFDKRTGRKRSKTFATITAAKLWRTDAGAALRAGTTASRCLSPSAASRCW